MTIMQNTFYDSHNANRLYDQSIDLETASCEIQQLSKTEGRVHILDGFDNKLLYTRQGHLICLDCTTHKEIWRKDYGGHVPLTAYERNGTLYIGHEEFTESITIESNQNHWKKNGFTLVFLSENYLVCDSYDDDNDETVLYALSPESGDIVWQQPYYNYYPGEFRQHNNLLLCQTEISTLALNEDTGEVVWQIVADEWLNKYFPQRLQDWRGRPGSGPLSPQIPIRNLHCVVDDIFYLSWEIGVIAAYRVKTGEQLWTWEFSDNNYALVHTMIVRNDRLYLFEKGYFGSESFLHCLDAHSGKLLFKSDKKITPAGCGSAIIMNKYLVASRENYLAMWDLDSFECVSLYEDKKGANFQGIQVVNNGIVISDSDNRCLHWVC